MVSERLVMVSDRLVMVSQLLRYHNQSL
jgi:hypothetical protein